MEENPVVARPAKGTQAILGALVAIIGALATANPTSAVLKALSEAAPQLAATLPTMLTTVGAIVAALSRRLISPVARSSRCKDGPVLQHRAVSFPLTRILEHTFWSRRAHRHILADIDGGAARISHGHLNSKSATIWRSVHIVEPTARRRAARSRP
jgi:hypothetical protein